jgi:serine/threonine protein phosphatase PrpC
MRETFEELDTEFAEKHPSSSDGCCACVALITGKRLVIGSLGDVPAVVCMKSGEAIEQLRPHSVKGEDEEDDDDEDEDEDGPRASRGAVEEVTTTGSADADGYSEFRPTRPIRYTRAFGDLEFKRTGSTPLLSNKPDVVVIHLETKHRGFAFICRALYNAIGRSVAVSTVFRRSAGRPRMASGALVDAAVQWLGQVGDLGLGSIVVSFDGLEDDSAPAQKRQRTEQPSQVRLRTILLKHRESKSTVDKVRNKQVKRLRGQAERILRAVLEECESDPKKTAFSQRCRELSECQSCLKTGEHRGFPPSWPWAILECFCRFCIL